MTDVMGLGHGGDGAGDPPPPLRGQPGHHESDPVPPRRKTRGPAKNERLAKLVEKEGPLSVPFDRAITYTSVGDRHDMLVREVTKYIKNKIPLDKDTWSAVSEAERNALYEHLRQNFKLGELEKDPEALRLMDGLEKAIKKRYRDTKANIKKLFMDNGGYDDVDRARAYKPHGMEEGPWNKAIDYFLSDGHRRRSEVNKANRQKQRYINRGGSSSFSSYAYKQSKSRLETFKAAHTDKDGNFYEPLAEEDYNKLKQEFDSQTQPATEAGPSSQPDEKVVFEKVLGVRRGHIKGIGRKPPTSIPSTCIGHGQEPSHQTLTQDQNTNDANVGDEDVSDEEND
ncbi:hypothetical protein SSX86_001424 [Deinandra increscens subsp. villosa]|uniref:Uncharacterized protein n=1 Tax=Deinandra increscens subsp. villosa TaxID=3103831 RepID=A0AAP0C753_9ASTR